MEAKLDEILRAMAFRCAGGITDDGQKEYTPAKQAIKKLFKELVTEIIGENDYDRKSPTQKIRTDNPLHLTRRANNRNELREEQRNLLKALEEK